MVNQKSFNEIITELKARKKWEKDSADKFDKATCKICKRVLSNVGRSNIVGICSGCVNKSMNPE